MKAKVFISFLMNLMILIILSISQSIFAQYSEEWVARYNDSSNSSDGGSYLTFDNLGNIYVAGTSDGRYLTVKYNSSGNKLWAALYHGHSFFISSSPSSIAADVYGNVYVTGQSNVMHPIYKDYATLKYDFIGNQSWVKIFNSPFDDHDRATAMAIDKNGNIIVTGNSVSPCVNGSFTWNTIKYSPAGNEIWVTRFCSYTQYIIGGSAPSASLALDSSGNIIVAGQSDSTFYNSSIIIKYNTAGQELWINRLPTSSNSCLVAADNSDNIYFATDSKLIKFDSNGDSLWVGEYDYFYLKKLIIDKWKNAYIGGTGHQGGFVIVKHDSNGVQKWIATDSTGRELTSMTTDDRGNIYAAGSTGTGITGNYYIVKFDSTGSKVWSAEYNGPADSSDRADDIAVDNSGSIYVTGISRGIGTNFDVATIKYSIITSSKNNSSEVIGFKLHQNYPNPFNPTTKINYSLPAAQYAILKVYDVLGNEVATLVNENQNPGSYSVEFNAANYPSGIYYYKLEAGEFSEVRKMILLK